MNNIIIGGVPEHFNYPWLRAVAAADFADYTVRWQDFPGGSGAMTAALDAGELDVAMLLSEAAVAGIAKGGRYRILSWYTRSPLIWGIHVPGNAADLNAVEDLRGARYAISRYGSGSHLMCFAHAKQRGWPVDELKFVVVGDLAGAVEAFKERRAEVFLWEKFMTKPLVESGQFKRLGDFAAPWPAFVVCVSEAALAAHRDVAVAMAKAALAEAQAAQADSGSAATIAQRYGLETDDVTAWLGITRWAERLGIEAEEIADLVRELEAIGIAPPGRDAAGFVVT
jgi:ABC-type nitrate/sulfonate/bicarbonate transport system substrate-binding protein